MTIVILQELGEAAARAWQMIGETMSIEYDANRRAIIDVGSNSVRLVIYEGPARTPFVVHNEKVQARLGRSLAASGRIDDEAYDKALRGCRRFKALLDAAGIGAVRTVATAAARDAENGPGFLDDLRASGLDPELLSGDQEAYGSAAGVLSAFPEADGIVGDLGGGSLELIDVKGGAPGRRDTFPLGVLRLAALRDKGDVKFGERIDALLRSGGWRRTGADRPFYLVGGSWRTLGHLDMHLSDSILPGVHGYAFGADRVAPMRAAIAELGPRLSKTVADVSASRVATLDDAALLLGAVADHIGSRELIVSSFGLREGLLYSALDAETQRQDPLLAAVADYARRRGNPTWRGEVVADWIEPVFQEPKARIRLAACHLAGVDLHAQSETRARHGMELAWLGGWIGVTAKDRAMLAQTLWTAWGGKGLCSHLEIVANGALKRAQRWGEAIRLAERLTGGTTAVLEHTRLSLEGTALTLAIDPRYENLAGDIVAKQLAALAQSLGANAAIGAR